MLGCTKLAPAAYDGWEGECPGCDRDLYRWAKLHHDTGFDGVTALYNAAATKPNIKAVFKTACAQLNSGDLLSLYFSGHGGQLPDISGDELDGKDETLCLFDGELIDDQIAVYLNMVPRGVGVLFVTDSCNSGTNVRGRARVKRGSPVQLGRALSDGFKVPILHIGGCTDGRSSYGDDSGGVLTNAILDTLARARKPLSYTELFARVEGRMPAHQRPVMATYGPDCRFPGREAMK